MTRKWSERPIWRLPGRFGYHLKRFVSAGDIEGPVRMASGCQDEDHCEVRQLLEWVVAVERVRLWRKVEGDVVDEVSPGIGHDLPGSRHQSPPLAGAEQEDHVRQRRLPARTAR